MYAFIKYEDVIIKIYHRCDDWQFICESPKFDKERWFTNHGTKDSIIHAVDRYFNSNGYPCPDISSLVIVGGEERA